MMITAMTAQGLSVGGVVVMVISTAKKWQRATRYGTTATNFISVIAAMVQAALMIALTGNWRLQGVGEVAEEFKRAYTFGFKPVQLTVQEFAMQDGDVDWISFLETFDTEHNIIPFKSDAIKISLMERTIIWQQREINKLKAAQPANS